jgi:hypothetical protein
MNPIIIRVYPFTCEAPPQPNEVMSQTNHCLNRSDAGCRMLDKKGRILRIILYPGTSIQYPFIPNISI